jgi:hypothetical protein
MRVLSNAVICLTSGLTVHAFRWAFPHHRPSISSNQGMFRNPISLMQIRTLQYRSLLSSMALTSSLLNPEDMWSMWASCACAAYAGSRAEDTPLGKSLSGPVCAMLISAILTNCNIMPPLGSVHITSLQSFAVKASIPLLLLGANLPKIIKETGYNIHTMVFIDF